jgi:hypothetical protein
MSNENPTSETPDTEGADSVDSSARIRGWLAGRLPADLYAGPTTVEVDREEITVVGPIPEPELPEGAGDPERDAARAGRTREWRERTRDQRIEIARELEHSTGRKVAWGATCGDRRELFTHLAVPVMTRLRQPERQVLDTLVASGVARSRADALAWCVRLVGQHSSDWLASLREAMEHVEKVRAQGPGA